MRPSKGPQLVVVHTFARALPLSRLAGFITRACASKCLTRGVSGCSSPGAKRGAIVNHVVPRRKAPAQCVVTRGTAVSEFKATPFDRGSVIFFMGEGSSDGWRRFHALELVAAVMENMSSRLRERHAGKRLFTN